MRGSSAAAAIAILGTLLAAPGALAQHTPADSKPPAPKSTGADDAKPETKAAQPGEPAAAKPEFPAKKNKNLYATNDYRGRKAPELKVEKWLTPAGKPAAPDTKGKVVLVDYWATWCGPCRRGMPELDAWQKEFKNDLVVIGISDEPAEKVQAYLAQQPVSYAMAIDTRRNEMTKSKIGIGGIPNVMIIDSTGICRWQGFPQSEEDTLTTEVLKQIIAADKAQRPAANKGDSKPAPTEDKPAASSPGTGK